MTSASRGWPWFHRIWWLACAGATACLVAARELHYLRTDWPLPVARAFDVLMHAGMHSIIIASLTLPAQAFVGLLLAAGTAVRRPWFRERRDGRWHSRPWLHSTIWTGIALNNYLIDLNPWVARVSLASAVVLFLPGRHRLWSLGLGAGFFAAWVASSPTLTDALAVAAWATAFLLLVLLAARVGARDRLWMGVGASVACQIGAAVLPLVLPRHGGIRIADGMAYGFCERTADGRLFAVVPGSSGGSDAFLTARLDEISSDRLSVVNQRHLFDHTFRGRAIAPLCLPDALQVAMAETQIGTTFQRENVMELSADGSRIVSRSLFGGDMGQTWFWDRERDAVFYASEWSNRIFRLDRRTRRVDREVGGTYIPQDQHHWFFFGRRDPGSLALSTDADYRRGTFVAAHWTTGSRAYEIDLETLQLRRRIETHHGATSSITMDEAYHRAFVTSPWGLDVFDLETGRPLARIRTGLGGRTTVLDVARALVYMPTTVEGRIHVFARTSLRRLGAIDVGYGPRNALFSDGAAALLATNARGYYYWKSHALAERFAPVARR
jgi:hypothetical protein